MNRLRPNSACHRGLWVGGASRHGQCGVGRIGWERVADGFGTVQWAVRRWQDRLERSPRRVRDGSMGCCGNGFGTVREGFGAGSRAPAGRRQEAGIGGGREAAGQPAREPDKALNVFGARSLPTRAPELANSMPHVCQFGRPNRAIIHLAPRIGQLRHECSNTPDSRTRKYYAQTRAD